LEGKLQHPSTSQGRALILGVFDLTAHSEEAAHSTPLQRETGQGCSHQAAERKLSSICFRQKENSAVVASCCMLRNEDEKGGRA
jgi:hypothetical protein